MDASTNHVLDEISAKFDEQLNYRRTVLLDIFEGLLGHTDQWSLIRQKLLKFVGDSGLRGDFFNIIENAKRTGVDNGDART